MCYPAFNIMHWDYDFSSSKEPCIVIGWGWAGAVGDEQKYSHYLPQFFWFLNRYYNHYNIQHEVITPAISNTKRDQKN